MKRVLNPAVAVVSLLLAGGCGSSSGNPGTATSTAETFPVTVGRLTLAQQPKRIVSLTATGTEMLFAIGAGSQVVAADDQSNYPPQAPKTDLSAYKPSAPAIAAKAPDLVVLSDDIDQIVAKLTKLKIPTFTVPAATSLNSAYQEIGQLGILTGHVTAAEALHQQMAASIDRIVKSVPARPKPLSYYYELDPTYYTVTSRTFVGSLFAMFGLTNVADDADPKGLSGGYPQLTAAALVKDNPDTIFLTDTECCGQSSQTVASRTGWNSITAVKSGHVFTLDDDVASRWGPRTVDLVQAVADAVAKVPADQ